MQDKPLQTAISMKMLRECIIDSSLHKIPHYIDYKGVSIDVTKNLTFLTKIGWLGYTSYKLDADDAKASTDLGLDLSGENLQFSLVYNF